MKPREPRQKVLVRARLKTGLEWHDGCILNISSRGMLMQAADPPMPGTYLEIRRGALVIIAKVMWAKQHRFGVRTQDRLPVEAIVADVAAPVIGEGVRVGERRSAKRQASWRQLPADQRSRALGRLIEYGFTIALAVAGAGMAAVEVYRVIAAPVDSVTAALASRR